MSLHPKDRPANVLIFRDALLGKLDAPKQYEIDRYGFEMPRIPLFSSEQIAGYVAFGLFIMGLIATVVR
jgi:hypothetical protein